MNITTAGQIWYRNQQMHVRVWMYIIQTVYPLHASATHVAIFREMRYKGQIYRNITEFSEPMPRHKTLNFKNNTWFKIRIKD
jgi:hypothetical protein